MMEKIKEFLKHRTIGYFMVAGLALVSLIVAIIFFAGYQNPSLAAQMGNKAEGFAVETIGIFLLAGFVVELVVLVVPQYRFIQIGAVAMFALAFYKEVLIIPDFIAGMINNVMYNGGNLGFNMFLFFALLIMVVVSIVAAFLGFYKKEEENVQDMKPERGNLFALIRIGVAGAVFVAAVLSSSLVSVAVTNEAGGRASGGIPSALQKAAKKYKYDFDPSTVLIEEQDSWDFNDATLKSVPNNKSRESDDCHLVYFFEGAYAEGYQGDYSQTYGYLYLWEDGLFGGRINSTDVKGYWYNSSSEAPEDNPDTPKNEAMDCLNLVSNVSKYESIIFEKASGFYNWRTHIYLGFSWGTRSMEIAGYLYYPEVGIYIDTQGSMPTFRATEEIDISFWTPTRVLKNLKASSVFVQTDVQWYIDDGSGEFTTENIKDGNSTIGTAFVTDAGRVNIEYVDGDKNRGISSITTVFDSKGKHDICIKWGEFEASYRVKVLDPLPEEDE